LCRLIIDGSGYIIDYATSLKALSCKLGDAVRNYKSVLIDLDAFPSFPTSLKTIREKEIVAKNGSNDRFVILGISQNATVTVEESDAKVPVKQFCGYTATSLLNSSLRKPFNIELFLKTVQNGGSTSRSNIVGRVWQSAKVIRKQSADAVS
jgi:hypothetical protein